MTDWHTYLVQLVVRLSGYESAYNHKKPRVFWVGVCSGVYSAVLYRGARVALYEKQGSGL